MRTPSPSWCGLDLTHLWPTGSSLGDPLITARNFSSCPSDSISRWTPCPPENRFSGRRRITAVFGYSAPHSSARGTSTLLINALLSAHHGPIGGSWPSAFLGYPRGQRV